MGAFDGELYALGYRFNNGTPAAKPKKPTKKEIWLENLHTPKMPCPGSCGSACANHFCSAHNGTPYEPEPLKYFGVQSNNSEKTKKKSVQSNVRSLNYNLD